MAALTPSPLPVLRLPPPAPRPVPALSRPAPPPLSPAPLSHRPSPPLPHASLILPSLVPLPPACLVLASAPAPRRPQAPNCRLLAPILAGSRCSRCQPSIARRL